MTTVDPVVVHFTVISGVCYKFEAYFTCTRCYAKEYIPANGLGSIAPNLCANRVKQPAPIPLNTLFNHLLTPPT